MGDKQNMFGGIGIPSAGDVFIGEIEYHQFKGQPAAAIEHLLAEKQGIAVAVYYHPKIGHIDLVYGGTTDDIRNKGYGLVKIANHHPEALEFLKHGNIAKMKAKFVSERKGWSLTNPALKFIIRVTYNGSLRNWIMTGFEKIKEM